MKPTFSATSPADLLAVVPDIVGFEPRESLVLVALSEGVSVGALRADLPTTDDLHELEKVATTLVGMVCKISSIDSVIAVAYVDRAFDRDEGAPESSLLGALVVRCDASGLHVFDALWVSSDAWGRYADGGIEGPETPDTEESEAAHSNDGSPFSSTRPRPLSLIESSTLPGELTLSGVWRHDIAELTTLVPAQDVVRQRRVARLLAAPHLAPTFKKITEMMLDHTDERYDLAARAEQLLASASGHSAERIAHLGWMVMHPELRDALLMCWAWGPETGRALYRAGEHPDPHLIASALGGFGMQRPVVSRIERAIDLLRQTTLLLPPTHRVPMIAMLAWLNWSLGRGTVAARWISLAFESDPNYPFALLLDAMVGSGFVPDWAFEVTVQGP